MASVTRTAPTRASPCGGTVRNGLRPACADNTLSRSNRRSPPAPGARSAAPVAGLAVSRGTTQSRLLSLVGHVSGFSRDRLSLHSYAECWVSKSNHHNISAQHAPFHGRGQPSQSAPTWPGSSSAATIRPLLVRWGPTPPAPHPSPINPRRAPCFGRPRQCGWPRGPTPNTRSVPTARPPTAAPRPTPPARRTADAPRAPTFPSRLAATVCGQVALLLALTEQAPLTAPCTAPRSDWLPRRSPPMPRPTHRPPWPTPVPIASPTRCSSLSLLPPVARPPTGPRAAEPAAHTGFRPCLLRRLPLL